MLVKKSQISVVFRFYCNFAGLYVHKGKTETWANGKSLNCGTGGILFRGKYFI